MRLAVCTWIAVLLCLSGSFASGPRMLPTKPDVLPEFRVPRENSRALDENWVYVQTLYDALQSRPDQFGAVPVGISKANQGRVFIATLHTIFRSIDGGRSWTNMDPQPAPTFSPSFDSFRSPFYISDIACRPVRRPEQNLDSIYITTFDSESDHGTLRFVRGFGNTHVVWPDTLLLADRWLTSVFAPDSHIAVALAGLDTRIYRNDSMQTSTQWDTLAEHFTGTWVKEHTTVGNFTYAVGSHQWLTLDRGYSWQTLPAADPFGDSDISFAPNSPHAIICGTLEEPPTGWARYTTDFGQTWSARTLQTNIPLRAALMLNDTLGYVAGGIANDAIGRVWRTIDGGATWELELEVEAEITELGYSRESGGYINVIATGYFADFRGGVWRSHLAFPDTSDAALVFSEDTLEFFAPVGQSVSHDVVLKNVGNDDTSVLDWFDIGPYTINCCTQDVLLQPGDSMVVTVTFTPVVDGDFPNAIRVFNDHGEFLELVVRGSTSTDVTPPVSLPQELSLAVYPNPGNAEFRLSYSLAKSGDVSLTLFDVTGREVATLVDGVRNAGEHVVNWSANSRPSGVYFAVLNAGDASTVTKLVLMK